VEVATGAETAQSPRPDGIGHAVKPVAAGDTGLWLLPTESYDAFEAVDLKADAAMALRILVGILEEHLALVRCLDW
jgi:hypothetical protein